MQWVTSIDSLFQTDLYTSLDLKLASFVTFNNLGTRIQEMNKPYGYFISHLYSIPSFDS
jgi:lysozyme family protein